MKKSDEKFIDQIFSEEGGFTGIILSSIFVPDVLGWFFKLKLELFAGCVYFCVDLCRIAYEVHNSGSFLAEELILKNRIEEGELFCRSGLGCMSQKKSIRSYDKCGAFNLKI